VDGITNRIANGLARLGIGKDDKVALLLPNSLEAVYLWFACSKLGAVDVPINLASRGFFLSHVINDSDAKLMVIDYELIDRLADIHTEVPKLEKVIVWSRGGSIGQLPELNVELIDYSQLGESPADRPQVKVKPSDVQTIIYTSGTTGPSKGVMMPHAQAYLEAYEYCTYMRTSAEDIFFTCLPIFHANARYLCLYPTLLSETKAVIRERLSATRFWDQIRAAKATIFNSLGAMATFLYNQPRKDNDGDNPARICLASPMPKEIYEDFAKRFTIKVIDGYGLTETGLILYNPYDSPRPGSCGKATESFRVWIVDEDDQPVPPNAMGEIVIQGRKPYGMCLGYYKQPEKTVETFRNFCFHTGDGGYIDEDGYVYFMDRLKDYIRRRGENISSFEVERVVDSHPKVLESAAIGVKSEVGEDEVMIVVVLKEGETVAPEELLSYCEPRMPYFAVPRYVEFVDRLPKTPNEKVQKAKLREAGVTTETWDRESIGYKVKR
jgi:crotonobetaine/carnitine-CoA ligase